MLAVEDKECCRSMIIHEFLPDMLSVAEPIQLKIKNAAEA